MKYYNVVMTGGKNIVLSEDKKNSMMSANSQFIETIDVVGNDVVINKAHIVQIVTDVENSKRIQEKLEKKERLKLIQNK